MYENRALTVARATFALIVTTTIVAVLLLTPALSASAHDELLSTDPATGTTLDALPAQITLTFSASVIADGGGNEVRVTDAAGTTLSDGDVVVADNVMTQALAGQATGPIQVAWRAVSQDGHPVSGEFSFTVTGSASASATPSAAPSATATTAATTPPATATPAVTATEAPSASDDRTSDDTTSSVPWIVIGVLAIAVVGVVVFLLVARSRRKDGTGGDHARSPGPSDRTGSDR